MKPIEFVPRRAALGLSPVLADGDMAVPLGLQVGALFLQKDVSENRQVQKHTIATTFIT
jgi:hypothetical protein